MFTGLTRRDFVKQAAMGASAAVIPAIARGAQANERIRLGWVGMGNRGEQLLTEVIKNFIREVRTVAVCDLLDNRVAKGVQLAGFDRPKGYADMRIMIEQERLDAVIVATPPATHAEVSIPVMQAGIHCLQEAPLETTVEKIDSLTRVARRAQVVFQIGAQRRYNP
ncbi:MAG: Gfo/Idh/MocA family oxidoreductase, partial [Planctomycetes bacterium]|nr:Gfo/Idh/MocA family oxidoreductase [Planctomycetota bacterium]